MEPQPPSLPSSKRKRTSPDENEAPEETKPVKPPSKNGRANASKGRAATRKSLEDVPESEAEYDEEDSPPAPKKARPSLDNDEQSEAEKEEEEEEEEKKPNRVRRAATRKAAAPATKRGAKTAVKDEEEDDAIVSVKSDSDDEPPRRKGGCRATKKEESSDDDFEDEKPARKARGGSVARSSAAPKAPRGRRASAAPKSSGRRGTRASVAPEEVEEAPATPAPVEAQTDDGNESDALSYLEPDATPRAAAPPSQAARPATPIAEQEEEYSLLDDSHVPRTPARAQPQAQTAPAEEPQGPKSRLVIHKMALVNFKSYAGRQEIGPFHKVRTESLCGSSRSLDTSRSPLSSAPTVQESRTRSMLCSLSSAIERRRCDRASSLSLSITPPATPILTNAASRFTSAILLT